MSEIPAYLNCTDAIVAAAHSGEYDHISFLINRGANVNAQDEFGNTGIICASERGYDAIVQMLVAAGGSVNVPNNDGDRPLDLARHAKHQSTIDLLLGLGAIGRDGSSAKEQMENAYYDECQVANSIKGGMLRGDGNE